MEGEEVLLEVPLRGHPSPEIEWLRDDQPIEPTDNSEISKDLVFGKLRIKKVTPGDSGVYKCVVSSQKGTTTKKFLLNVESMLIRFYEIFSICNFERLGILESWAVASY